jgi:hypothetical protein
MLKASEEKTFHGFLVLLLVTDSALVVPGFFGKNIKMYSNKQHTELCELVLFLTITNLLNRMPYSLFSSTKHVRGKYRVYLLTM